MRVLMLTMKVDQHDWLLGFIHGWVEQLARHPRIDRLDVICLERGAYDLPDNVRLMSMGKEHGHNRLRELLAFGRGLSSSMGKADVLFGHMIPRYTLIAAPWALAFGVPMVQWYTHRQVHLELRLAHALVDRVVTASPESFTLPSRKVRVIGHGIDMARFRPAPLRVSPFDEGRLIVAVGRLSPIKNYPTLIQAAAHLMSRPGFEDVRVIIAGGATAEDPQYGSELQRLVDDLGIEKRVEFLGAVPHEQIPMLYRRAAVTVNLCPTGGVDKAVIESMASGVPVVVWNRTFLSLLGDEADRLWCPELDPDLVADRLAVVLSMPAEQRRALGDRLRERVQAAYDLEGLIDRLVGVFEEVIAARGSQRARGQR